MRWLLLDHTSAVLLFLLSLIRIGCGGDGRPLKFVCYTETWARTRTSPMNYDLDLLPSRTCDYLIIMHLTLDPTTWKLKMHNGYTAVEPADLWKGTEVRSRSPDMKVLVSLGGWEDGVTKYTAMMAERSRRQAYIHSVVEVLDKYDLDGVDLHWLFPGALWRGGHANDRGNFLQLVRELTRAFKPRRWLLTASVPADRDALEKGYLVRRLNSYLHQFHLRTFDMRGDWNGVAENHSPLFLRPNETAALKNLNVNDAVSMWLERGVSKKKLVPTFALYGRSFTLKDPAKNSPGAETIGPGQSTPYVRAPGIIAYYEICDHLQNGDMERKYVLSTQTPYASEGDQWVGYDDEVSLQKKVKFIRHRGLAGAALHPISLDDFTGKCGPPHLLVHKMREFLSDPDL